MSDCHGCVVGFRCRLGKPNTSNELQWEMVISKPIAIPCLHRQTFHSFWIAFNCNRRSLHDLSCETAIGNFSTVCFPIYHCLQYICISAILLRYYLCLYICVIEFALNVSKHNSRENSCVCCMPHLYLLMSEFEIEVRCSKTCMYFCMHTKITFKTAINYVKWKVLVLWYLKRHYVTQGFANLFEIVRLEQSDERFIAAEICWWWWKSRLLTRSHQTKTVKTCLFQIKFCHGACNTKKANNKKQMKRWIMPQLSFQLEICKLF